jgi:hypothetical protein
VGATEASESANGRQENRGANQRRREGCREQRGRERAKRERRWQHMEIGTNGRRKEKAFEYRENQSEMEVTA